MHKQHNMQSHYSTPQPNKSILNEEHNVIKLIRLFRGHECLWNPNCEEYRNLALKESIWESIADQFDRQVTADQVKRKIKGLRNCFATERTRVQKSIMDGREVYVPTLYYYKEFEFLHSIVKSSARASYGNVKAEYGTEDYEENNSHEDNCIFNGTYGENNDYTLNDGASNVNEVNDEMKIFEPIVTSRVQDEQHHYEMPAYKRLRTRQSYNINHTGMKVPERVPINRHARQVQSLCEMIKVDLQDVSEELFFDAKWRIMDILRDVHRKQLEKKCQTIASEGQTSSTSGNSNSSTSSSTASSSGSGQGVAVTSSAAVMHNNQYATN